MTDSHIASHFDALTLKQFADTLGIADDTVRRGRDHDGVRYIERGYKVPNPHGPDFYMFDVGYADECLAARAKRPQMTRKRAAYLMGVRSSNLPELGISPADYTVSGLLKYSAIRGTITESLLLEYLGLQTRAQLAVLRYRDLVPRICGVAGVGLQAEGHWLFPYKAAVEGAERFLKAPDEVTSQFDRDALVELGVSGADEPPTPYLRHLRQLEFEAMEFLSKRSHDREERARRAYEKSPAGRAAKERARAKAAAADALRRAKAEKDDSENRVVTYMRTLSELRRQGADSLRIFGVEQNLKYAQEDAEKAQQRVLAILGPDAFQAEYGYLP